MAIVSQDGPHVLARVYNPQSWNGSRADTRTVVFELDLGDSALVGLTPPVLALTIAQAIVRALSAKYGRPEAPAPPGGPRGRLVNVPLPGLDNPC